MNSLKKCLAVTSLIIMLAATALAECPNPGEQSGPPCLPTQQITDDPPVGTTTQSAISGEVEIITINAVIEALESLLTVY